MKFHIWKDLVTQISYFKSDWIQCHWGGGNLGIRLLQRDHDETLWDE